MKPKYKWLIVRNRWTDEIPEGWEDQSELDALPDGWYKAFGEQMADELNDLLVKYNYDDQYRIAQIKEKYGGLRWYDNGFPKDGWEEYMEWLHKYEWLSEKTCISCGEPGEVRTDIRWILPLCDEHYHMQKGEKQKAQEAHDRVVTFCEYEGLNADDLFEGVRRMMEEIKDEKK